MQLSSAETFFCSPLLALDIGEVIEKGPEVDPDSSILQNPVNDLDKLEDVVGAVDEEASDYGVLTGDLLRGGVHVNKYTGGHRELGVLGERGGVHIWEGDLPQLVPARLVVTELVDVGMDRVAVHRDGLILEEVAGKQHVQHSKNSVPWHS